MIVGGGGKRGRFEDNLLTGWRLMQVACRQGRLSHGLSLADKHDLTHHASFTE
jgi:hypothetical protein